MGPRSLAGSILSPQRSESPVLHSQAFGCWHTKQTMQKQTSCVWLPELLHLDFCYGRKFFPHFGAREMNSGPSRTGSEQSHQLRY